MYRNKFLSALNRTKSLNLYAPEVFVTNEKLLTKEMTDTIPQILFNEFGPIDPDSVHRKCMGFHYQLKPVLEKAFSQEIYYTLGNVKIDNQYLFQVTENNIHELLEKKVSEPLNIHAWLTLPSMEILDFSLATTYSIVKNLPEGLGASITKHPDELTGGMKYEPMIIGDDFLRQIGGLIEFEIE